MVNTSDKNQTSIFRTFTRLALEAALNDNNFSELFLRARVEQGFGGRRPYLVHANRPGLPNEMVLSIRPGTTMAFLYQVYPLALIIFRPR